MAPVNYQTIKLGRGKHTSPEDGACVMELASMLAGEPFSDHPVSVCPVIGAFLRAYNDSVEDDRRQDLYRYAAKAVGSRGSNEVQQVRAELLTEWTAALKRRRRFRWLSGPWCAALAPATSQVGVLAVHAIRRHDQRTHDEVLRLLDQLLAIRSPGRTAASHTRSPQRDRVLSSFR
jgi:hypothetical protein